MKTATSGQIVTIGRIKGRILKGDKVYRTVSEKLNQEIDQVYLKENIKRPINATIYLEENKPMKLETIDLWSNIKVIKTDENINFKKAEKNGITKERIEEQISKTGNTPFEVKSVAIKMESNIIIPISALNNIRRLALEELQNKILASFTRSKKSFSFNA